MHQWDLAPATTVIVASLRQLTISSPTAACTEPRMAKGGLIDMGLVRGGALARHTQEEDHYYNFLALKVPLYVI